MKIILIIALAMVNSFANMDFESLLPKLLRPLKECPEKIWPGYTPKAEFIISFPSKNLSYVIGLDHKVTQIPFETLPTAASEAYSFENKDGKDIVYFNWENSWGGNENYQISTLYHEAFHYLGQRYYMPKVLRGELMPMDSKGRIARLMQIRNLKAYSASKDQNKLKQAKFWEDWISTNRPEDKIYNQAYDVSEGSAEYVGLISAAVVRHGCDISDDQIKEFFLENDLIPEISSREFQAYPAGAFGYLIAHLHGEKDIFKKVEESPVSQVLSTCEAMSEEEDPALAPLYEEVMGPQNKAISEAVERLESVESYVAIPESELEGSFTTEGFFQVKLNGQVETLLPKFNATFSIQDATQTVTDADIIYAENICNQANVYITPATPELLKYADESKLLYGKKSVRCLR